MRPFAIRLAERVILAADRAHPADAVLKQTLKAQRQLSPKDAAAVSRAVFAYYRWLGWLSKDQPLSRNLQAAQELAAQFAADPRSVPEAQLAQRAVPSWIADEMEVRPDWLRALQTEPKLWLRAKAGRSPDLLAKLGPGRIFGEGPLSGIIEYTGEKDLFRTPEFHAGEFELQDLNSQAVGLICEAHPGETWWDACAGEGGKTVQLSEMMQNRGLIWASDRAEWRLQHLKRRAARAGIFNYRGALWDGGPKLPTKTKFDGVLMDAPCSGLGTWQRNPHARWTTTLEDVKELSRVQQTLLQNAAQAVKPGGRLVYAVCTMTRSETENVAEAFQKRFEDFEPMAVKNPLDQRLPAAVRWQLWPQDFGGNGMFVAVWKRNL